MTPNPQDDGDGDDSSFGSFQQAAPEIPPPPPVDEELLISFDRIFGSSNTAPRAEEMPSIPSDLQDAVIANRGQLRRNTEDLLQVWNELLLSREPPASAEDHNYHQGPGETASPQSTPNSSHIIPPLERSRRSSTSSLSLSTELAVPRPPVELHASRQVNGDVRNNPDHNNINGGRRRWTIIEPLTDQINGNGEFPSPREAGQETNLSRGTGEDIMWVRRPNSMRFVNSRPLTHPRPTSSSNEFSIYEDESAGAEEQTNHAPLGEAESSSSRTGGGFDNPARRNRYLVRHHAEIFMIGPNMEIALPLRVPLNSEAETNGIDGLDDAHDSRNM
ncbi:hypothetical protein FE257_003406 [Aspergillus nanangensis]|uniref:Uncharacterized protein n=1 Tax=Aspergillus nanangensis TaxID=2582783 RepID=A0AAD4CC12_ASPNN|nr:hypothetical protein FE257_003406 [Aspergillus nanangensis]